MNDKIDLGLLVRQNIAKLNGQAGLPQVTVNVKSQGQHFACYAIVRRGGKTLHVTRDFPSGFDSAARDAARKWAEENYYRV